MGIGQLEKRRHPHPDEDPRQSPLAERAGGPADGGARANTGKDADEGALLLLLLVEALHSALDHHVLAPVIPLDMGHLVAEDVGQLRLVINQRKHTRRDVDSAGRKRAGFRDRIERDFESVELLRILGNYRLADPVDVILHERIVVERVIDLQPVSGASDLLVMTVKSVCEVCVFAMLLLLLVIEILDFFAEHSVFGVKLLAELLDFLVFALLFRLLFRVLGGLRQPDSPGRGENSQYDRDENSIQGMADQFGHKYLLVNDKQRFLVQKYLKGYSRVSAAKPLFSPKPRIAGWYANARAGCQRAGFAATVLATISPFARLRVFITLFAGNGRTIFSAC